MYFVTSRPWADHFPGPLHHRSTILSVLGLPFPHGFVFGNSRATSQYPRIKACWPSRLYSRIGYIHLGTNI
ncbi:hypothetical protein DVH24_022161 [Malus domestica]|uniref:Uncharacterized protein n=1 Tax=Malus domestica TaxID=3750 RepID=A0A498IU05_MALDO|nr:hypothetical protein DVH24_022161 [Malus domestica]